MRRNYVVTHVLRNPLCRAMRIVGRRVLRPPSLRLRPVVAGSLRATRSLPFDSDVIERLDQKLAANQHAFAKGGLDFVELTTTHERESRLKIDLLGAVVVVIPDPATMPPTWVRAGAPSERRVRAGSPGLVAPFGPVDNRKHQIGLTVEPSKQWDLDGPDRARGSVMPTAPRSVFRTLLVVACFAVLGVGRAWAIPAFARKYKTSCTTCHTIFPKLNPFGEQFRRNGYRFPGVDGDSTKAVPIPLGTDEQKKMFPDAVWPATLTPFPPLAIGFNGQAVIHPDRHSSAAAADNGAVFTLDNQIEEAHVWAAGSIDDAITFYGELTVAPDGVSLESGSLFFGDLVGPDHAVNVAVGKRGASLTSFAPHSSYIADMALPMVPVTALFGATSAPFQIGENHEGIEVNGVLASRLGYAAGLAAGTNLDTRNSANIYAHVGYKLGGATLDGEDTVEESPGGMQDHSAHDHLVNEQSITFDAFAYRSISRFSDPTMALTKDTSLTLGGAIRLQSATLELDTGAFLQTDDHVMADRAKVTTMAQWNEASWLPYPWLVVAMRVEFLRVAVDGESSVSDLRVTPGVAVLLRQNLRLALTAPIERASGSPDAGWGAAGLAAAPSMPGSTVGPEIEAIEIGLFTAF